MMGKRISDISKSRGITMEALAKACGVSVATVSRWISGKFSPSYDKLRLVCEALQCESKDLLGF